MIEGDPKTHNANHIKVMDYPPLFLLLSFVLTCIYVLFGRRNSRLPPGPYPFPVIGNILKLSDKPHVSLAGLSKHYGPLMSLKLGSKTAIVVSSPDVAKEIFHIHDRTFSSRSVPTTGRVVDHHKFSIAWLPAEDRWRRLRRICKEYLFSAQRLDATEVLRTDKVQELLDHANRCCTNGQAVNFGEIAFTTTLNVLSNFIFSMNFAQYESASSQELKDTIWALLEVAGKPNLADFFPILKPLDPQGLFRVGTSYAVKLLTIFDKIIDQRLQRRLNNSSYDGVSSTKNDVLDLLLSLNVKDESEFSRNDMRHLFLDLFVAGTDTTSSTLEWAMTELLRNPEKMKNTQSELMKIMGNNSINIQELDISRMPYLQAVIKETFRLHPPAPFLVPHEAVHDVEVWGFIVPKNAQVLCNVWAMGRDPNVWSDPKMFMPERFLDTKIDYKGHDFELIPFGAGRRICPGINLAHRLLPIMLGSLIYKFDWKLDGDLRAQDINMEEKFGLTLQRKVPLMAIPIKL